MPKADIESAPGKPPTQELIRHVVGTPFERFSHRIKYKIRAIQRKSSKVSLESRFAHHF